MNSSERALEAFLFGSTTTHDDTVTATAASFHHDEDVTELQDDDLFVVDTNETPETRSESEEDASLSPPEHAAWHDDDDDDVRVDVMQKDITRKLRQDVSEVELSGREVSMRLRKQFARVHGTPTWAQPRSTAAIHAADDDEEDHEGEALFQRTGALLQTGPSRTLPVDRLEIARCRDANIQAPSESIVESLHWHPQASVLLTAGPDKTLRLFHVDGKENAKIKSVYFKDLPIKSARFAPGGHEILVTGRRSYFYTFDLEHERAIRIPYLNGRSEKSWEYFEYSPCGRFIAFQGDRGQVVLVGSQTKQPLGLVQMNAPVRTVTFAPDGHYMYTAGRGSDVYIWDLRNQRQCVHRFMDEGVLKSSNISMSPTGAYFASGSTSGIVNIYDTPSLTQSKAPQPRKVIDNLTTNISQVEFNHDGQLLAMGSRVKKDAFRLVHLPSGRVFSNWPTQQTPLSYVQTFGFSSQSHFLAMGNAKGKVLLYNLTHYNQ